MFRALILGVLLAAVSLASTAVAGGPVESNSRVFPQPDALPDLGVTSKPVLLGERKWGPGVTLVYGTGRWEIRNRLDEHLGALPPDVSRRVYWNAVSAWDDARKTGIPTLELYAAPWASRAFKGNRTFLLTFTSKDGATNKDRSTKVFGETRLVPSTDGDKLIQDWFIEERSYCAGEHREKVSFEHYRRTADRPRWLPRALCGLIPKRAWSEPSLVHD